MWSQNIQFSLLQNYLGALENLSSMVTCNSITISAPDDPFSQILPHNIHCIHTVHHVCPQNLATPLVSFMLHPGTRGSELPEQASSLWVYSTKGVCVTVLYKWPC